MDDAPTPEERVERHIGVVARLLHAEGWTARRRPGRLIADWRADERWARLDVRVEAPADVHPADRATAADLLLEFTCSDRDPATLTAVLDMLRALERPAR